MKSTAQILKNAADSIGVDFRESYSGRGMYGKSCIGIVGANVFEILTSIVENHDAADVIDFRNEIVEIMDELSDYSTDSMGRDTIIYWPNIESE